MDMTSKFASSVLKSRLSLGYTQSQVAEAVSVSVRWYQKVESGKKFPGSITLVRLVLFLHIDLEDLREEANLVVPVRSVRRKSAIR